MTSVTPPSYARLAQVVEALECARPYVEADYKQRKALYEPYGMERKWTAEFEDLCRIDAALELLESLLDPKESP